jgi:hypothetical protein
MRRIMFAVLAGTMLLAVAPSTALARHHHRGHHHARLHRAVSREYWGSDGTQQTASGNGQGAGSVASFTGGVLTITLNDGSTVSGVVTDATELECQAPEQQTVQTDVRMDGGGDTGDDNGGNGNRGGDNGNRAGGDGNQGGDTGDQGCDQGDNEQTCSSSTLASGVVVQTAELDVSSSGAVWKTVEMITQ